jgi:hypothetical protein
VRRLDNGQIGYRWSWNGEAYDLTDDDVFHVRGFGGGPLGGLSTLAYARESLGNSIAAERAAGSLFANGARPSGTLSFEKFLTRGAKGDRARRIDGRVHGSGERGTSADPRRRRQMGIDPDERRRRPAARKPWLVGRGYLPLVRSSADPVGHSEKQSSWGTGVEQVMLAFLKFSLAPMVRRIEQSIASN